jgi:hypothetical protein
MSTTNTPAAGTPAAAAAAEGTTGTPAAATATPGTTATPNGETPAGTPGAAPAATQTPEQIAAAAAAAAPVVPEKYELAVPDGGPLDASDLEQFAALAKEKGWTNEQAQAAVTEHASALAAQSTQFLSDLKAHTEVGGEKLAVAQQLSRSVIDKFLPADSPEGQVLRSGLDKTGYGNWTPLVLLLSRIGKAMAEDAPLGTDSARGAGAPRDAAAVLYGG